MLLSSLSFNLGCTNVQTDMKDKINADTLRRPTSITDKAVLLNFGSEEEPILVWADYTGPLSQEGKVYSHIHGVQYFYVKTEQRDTFYYENMELRNHTIEFDFKNCIILNYPGEATIQISNKKNSLLLFHVLESNEFAREHKGIEFKRMPTIALDDDRFLADVDMEFNLKKVKEGRYDLTLSDTFKVEYKACSNCNITNQKISFLNRQDGRIYFVEKDCYLELVNKDNAKIFQGLR